MIVETGPLKVALGLLCMSEYKNWSLTEERIHVDLTYRVEVYVMVFSTIKSESKTVGAFVTVTVVPATVIVVFEQMAALRRTGVWSTTKTYCLIIP